MNDRIREAFDNVQAEEELKERTKKFLSDRTGHYQQIASPRNFRKFAIACAFGLCLLLGGGGYGLYFIPTSVISMDINPSVELDINRFDKVIAVKGYNEDGKELVDSLSLKYMDYEDAVGQIMESGTVEECMSRDEILSIAVTGQSEEQSSRIFAELQSCTKGQKNTYCFLANQEDVAAAHEAGLSYGKYRAFLQLQELDPDVSVDEIQGKTMREIRDRIEELSGETWGCGNGNGKRYGNRWK